MKAVVFTKEGNSEIKEVEIPKISSDQVLLKVGACAVCGTDIKLESGRSSKLDKHGKGRKMNYPMISGHELSGEIVKIGKDISGYKTGDRVNVMPNLSCGKCYYCQIGRHELCDDEKVIGFDYNGAFAEYMLIPDRAIRLGCVNKLSDNITFEEGALIEPVGVSINCQYLSNIGLNDTVLIIGAGPLGCINVELAKINGAKKVILAQRSKFRLEFAKKFMADVYISTTEEDITERVLEETNGEGPDKIILCCSSDEMFGKSLDMARKMGTINFFASLSKDNPFVNLDCNLIHYREIKITGTYNSTPLQNRIASELIEKGAINVKELITHKFDLNDYYNAINTAKSGEAMKVMVNPK